MATEANAVVARVARATKDFNMVLQDVTMSVAVADTVSKTVRLYTFAPCCKVGPVHLRLHHVRASVTLSLGIPHEGRTKTFIIDDLVGDPRNKKICDHQVVEYKVIHLLMVLECSISL